MHKCMHRPPWGQNVLVEKKVFQKFGTTGRGTYYTLYPALKAQKAQKSRTKGATEQ